MRPVSGKGMRTVISDSGESVHEAVLLKEVVKELIATGVAKGSWYLDPTLGGAGHAMAMIEALRGDINMICLDRDPQAIHRASQTLRCHMDKYGHSGDMGRIVLECEDFRNLDKVLVKNDIRSVDMVLFDLGLSSDELESSGRGFTFMKDEPLLMTMGDPSKYPFTAYTIVNGWNEEDIANVIYGYGEERFARRIAKAIVCYRSKKKIDTTFELVEIVRMSVPAFYRRGKTHPATKTFQALRIAVNDELTALREGLNKGYEALKEGGRMAVISFHSLEDRIVKEFYKEKSKNSASIISKKPITPSPQEIGENPRSRSAKLRIIKKLNNIQ